MCFMAYTGSIKKLSYLNGSSSAVSYFRLLGGGGEGSRMEVYIWEALKMFYPEENQITLTYH